MKTFFKWFDLLLNLLFAVIVLVSALIFFISQETVKTGNALQSLTSSSIEKEFGSAITYLLFLALFFSAIYVITGIALIIIGKRKKIKENISFGKGLFIKGLVKGIIAFFLFFILSVALSFFGWSSETLMLPRIPTSGNPNYSDTGFPIKDLQIIDKKNVNGDTPYCFITIINKNASMSAVNVSVMDDNDENDYVTDQSYIAPGKTFSTSIYGSNQGVCGKVLIKDAGIVKF